MDNNTITALAREYAEELYPNLSDKIISLRTQEIRNAERLIRFLLRRYALVEKSKLKEAYKDAQKDQHNSERDFALTIAGRNRSAVLIDLFPDLTWSDEPQEVEIIIKRKKNG